MKLFLLFSGYAGKLLMKREVSDFPACYPLDG
jgi:hypothetical protein